MKRWNQHQSEILSDAERDAGDTIVLARAGTGKTTVMLAAAERFPESCSVVFLAFNSRIKEEVSRKAPQGVDVRTIHSLGRGALYSYAKGRGRQLGDPSGNKTRNLIKKHWPAISSGRAGSMASACEFAKNTLATTADDIARIVVRLDLDVGRKPKVPDYAAHVETFCADVLRLLELEVKAWEDTLEYNFDDMIWLPVKLGLRVRQYDRVIIDEGQDLNPCQHVLARSARADGGRIILVGDDRQAIYSWRGADERGIERFRDELGARVLRLPITYRCGRAIVDLARRAVPDYEAAPSNPEGVVDSAKTEAMIANAKPGDAILSRVNAPLMSVCLELLKRGKRARIVGKDVGRALLALVGDAEKAGVVLVPALVRWIDAWRNAEVERIESRDPPGNPDPIHDRAECILTLAEGQPNVRAVRDRIAELFTDDPGQGEIVLSSTHKAKGLEWDTVWMLADTYRPAFGGEEQNLWYVAVTRAIHRLVLVSDKRAPELRAAPVPNAPPIVKRPSASPRRPVRFVDLGR